MAAPSRKVKAMAEGTDFDVVSTIQELMSSDDTNDSARILRTYRNASPGSREVIDDVLIALCGYSLPSIVEQSDELETFD